MVPRQPQPVGGVRSPKLVRCRTFSMESKEIYSSLCRLETWVQKANWRAYDTFDGLSSPWARFFTWNHPFLKQAWQQGVRRFPLNVRPLLGIKPGMSTK